jgi:hypothetical protein
LERRRGCGPKCDRAGDRPEPGGAPPRDGVNAYGWGEYDWSSGLYEGYSVPLDQQEAIGRPAVTWETILGHWELVEADLHQVYGVDLGDPSLRRSWRWLKLRIAGLCSTDCRLSGALSLPDDPSSTSATDPARPAAYDDPS